MAKSTPLKLAALVLGFSALACRAGETLQPTAVTNLPLTSSPTATTVRPTESKAAPDEPTVLLSHIPDASPAVSASIGTTNWGDLFFAGLLERPFEGESMTYRGDLDLTGAELARDGSYLYVTLYLTEKPLDNAAATYGAEFDFDLDDRPDALALAQPRSREWEPTGSLLLDENGDVGGGRPRLAEPNLPQWNGFETSQEELTETIWSRWGESRRSVQLALPRTVAGSASSWVWRAWAWDSSLAGGTFEPNDMFTMEEAGSPDPRSSYYPLATLDRADNTCLDPVGGYLLESGPGYCGIEAVVEGDPDLHPDDIYYGDEFDDSSVTLLLPTPTETAPPPPGATGTPDSSLTIPNHPALQPTPHPVFIGPGNYLIPTATPPNQLVVVTSTPVVAVVQTPESIVVTTPTPIVLVVVTPTPILPHPVDPSATPAPVFTQQVIESLPTQQIEIDPGDIGPLYPTATPTQQINIDPGQLPPILP